MADDRLPPGAVWLFRVQDLGSEIPLPIRLRTLLKRLLRALDFRLVELPIPEQCVNGGSRTRRSVWPDQVVDKKE